MEDLTYKSIYQTKRVQYNDNIEKESCLTHFVPQKDFNKTNMSLLMLYVLQDKNTTNADYNSIEKH